MSAKPLVFIILWISFFILGCGDNYSSLSQAEVERRLLMAERRPQEPTLLEVEQGFKEAMFGNPYESRNNLRLSVHKIKYGKWGIVVNAERNGEERTLCATAVMDENGGIHYYTN